MINKTLIILWIFIGCAANDSKEIKIKEELRNLMWKTAFCQEVTAMNFQDFQTACSFNQSEYNLGKWIVSSSENYEYFWHEYGQMLMNGKFPYQNYKTSPKYSDYLMQQLFLAPHSFAIMHIMQSMQELKMIKGHKYSAEFKELSEKVKNFSDHKEDSLKTKFKYDLFNYVASLSGFFTF